MDGQTAARVPFVAHLLLWNGTLESDKIIYNF